MCGYNTNSRFVSFTVTVWDLPVISFEDFVLNVVTLISKN